MKTENRACRSKFATCAERFALFCAVMWAGVTGWLFLFSAVAEPPLPPPQVARFLMDVRMLSLSGWLLAQIPLWCLWLDCKSYGVLPTLSGWLRRYGFIAAASLVAAFRIFYQRGYPAIVAEGDYLSYIFLWSIFGIVCLFRKPAE
ncbi:hypothetical protein [Pantoea dispersa]|uniref:hypothetical protein n=1 Tax=Pantoea dispersa TaxID=59814 RepID=UPI00123BF4AF|nr:hypothetical protein [Pantoea dispersa]KAA8669046.1 hypothetical protein F4W08_17285 [Pantoea dispersa]